ncbi:hypothetical protein HMPREF9445_02448 [Bacteroides clarus YIT 12056]|uniref:Uncharacterized protein n=1 Tax=Bacteroides clarus YIT 12056 TaxID=762984 RepID=A0ABN0CM23_9BACE|nr:hypothetical protein HMPREF9445_02448 [Bacteroides clarus YIT 12056]
MLLIGINSYGLTYKVLIVLKKRKKDLSITNKRGTFVPDYSAPGLIKCFLSD